MGYSHDGTAPAIEELAVPWMSLAGAKHRVCVRLLKRDLCPTLGEGAEVPRTQAVGGEGGVAGLPGGQLSARIPEGRDGAARSQDQRMARQQGSDQLTVRMENKR